MASSGRKFGHWRSGRTELESGGSGGSTKISPFGLNGIISNRF
jgi:hypothetical protein